MKMTLKNYLIIILLMVLPSACSIDFLASGERRVEIAQSNSGEIKIVAIQSLKNSSYINGILLAAKEINQRPEKLLNRTLKIQVERDNKTFEGSKYTIGRIVSDPRVTAVLGHRTSTVSVPASAIYEQSKVIFLPSFATGKSLTGHNFKYVFRMVPSSVVMGEQIAFAAKTLGYKKIVIFYGRDELSKEEAFLFENAAIKFNIDIITRISFFSKSSNYRPKISQLSDQDFDAIFMASNAEPAGRLTLQLREMGIMHPILGDDSFTRPEYLAAAGDSAKNVIAPVIYNSSINSEISRKFKKNYYKIYHEEPDANAALGYDSLMLIANTIQKAKTTLPSVLVSALHYMPAWVGITGMHSFNESGEIRGKKYIFQVYKKGKWNPLPALHVPHSLYFFKKYQIEKSNAKNPEVTDFLKIFNHRMHTDDRKTHLIDLAHEILRFKQVGIIYEDTVEGRKLSDFNMLASVANRKDIKVISCKIPFSILSKEQIQTELIACYGKLPLQSDAIYISNHTYGGVSKKFMQVLNKNLNFLNVPTFSIGTGEVNPYISLSLENYKDLSQKKMSVYKNILVGLKIHEFSERMQGIPNIIANLKHFQKYDLSEQTVIRLSPDTYSHLSSSVQKIEN